MCPVCGMLQHLVGILFPHINDDARSKSHKKCQVLFCAYFYDKIRNVVQRNTVTLSDIGYSSSAIPA